MITWNISQLDRQTSDGFVTTAHWTAAATDGDYSASVYSTCSWSGGTATIPYADLTNDIVIGWVQYNIGPDLIAAIQGSLAIQVERQINPPPQPEVLPLPWVPEPTPPEPVPFTPEIPVTL